MPQNKPKSFFKMTDAEKEAFIGKLERGIPRRQLRPLSKSEKALWQAAKRSPGRPRKPLSEKAIPVQVTFTPELLAAIDARAQQRGMTRAQFLAEGAKLALMKRSA